MSTNIYAERDHEAQGAHYLRHIDRMTVEGLYSKSAIAGELAHRDAEIERLKAEIAETDKVFASHQRTIAKQSGEIAALKAAAPAIPAGFKLVPLEPTDEMCDAADKAETRHQIDDLKRGGRDPQLSFAAAYRAMIEAAPDA